MKKRNPVGVVALTLLSFGLYAYYWLYKTTAELKEETGREDLNPAVDLLLAIATVGIWGIWAGYRNAKIVHEEMTARGQAHSDRAGAVAGVAALSFVSGWAWLVAMAMLQDDLNVLESSEVDVFTGAEPFIEVEDSVFDVPAAHKVRARVELEPAERPSEVSRWAKAPSAPVFRSNAPMPTVF